MLLNVDYAGMFRRRYVRSMDLMQPHQVEWLKVLGFQWIRPVRRPWAETLRNPTVGRVLEATVYPDVGSVTLGSPEGARLIRGLSVRS